MKVAVISESEADEAAIRVLVEGILQDQTGEVASYLRSRPGGWPHVRQLLPGNLSYLHYNTEAEALVVVVDSDDSIIHERSHESAGGEVLGCRLCELLQIVESRQALLRDKPRLRANQGIIKVALGLAVPAIEAWYQALSNPHVNEAAWNRHLKGAKADYTRLSLKADVYGADPMAKERSREIAVAAASSLTHNLPALEERFRVGFGHLADEIRKWRQ